MVNKRQQQPYIFLYILVFFTMIFQGGYFATGLLIVNISFIIYLLVNKEVLKLDINLIFMLSLLGVMIVSTIVKSVDYYVSIVELLKYSLLPLSYLVFMKIKDQERVRTIFFRSFILLMVFGLLSVLGFSMFSGMVTVNGNRLQSFLQYANTTALFMGIGALFSFDRFLNTKKKYYVLLSILFSVALLLTQSRITFVVFFLILAIYIFKFFNFKVKLIFVSSLIGLIALLFFFDGRIIKLSLFEGTFIERIITFQDAVRIIFQNIFGLGTGNWQFMQFEYQSAPYQVRYVHNIFLQAGVDGGFIAVILFAGLIMFNLVRAYKAQGIYLYIYLFVSIHSLFEVNFNYGIMIMFFTYMLTCFGEPVYLPKKIMDIKQQNMMSKFKFAMLIPLIGLVILLISEIIGSNASATEARNRQEAYAYYQAAYKLNPLNNELLFKQAKLERNVDQAIDYLEASYHNNPYNYQVLKALSEGYLYKKDFDRAYFYATHLFEIFPYHRQHQLLVEEVLSQFYDMGTISTEQYNQYHTKIQNQISNKDATINPLYRYINSQFDY